jgi:hypothetical protein
MEEGAGDAGAEVDGGALVLVRADAGGGAVRGSPGPWHAVSDMDKQKTSNRARNHLMRPAY